MTVVQDPEGQVVAQEAYDRLLRDRNRYRDALSQVLAHLPSTKGLDPKDRAARLHNELERRRGIAREALKEG